MLNTTNNNTTLNTPATGIVQKSNNSSFFLTMHQNSELAKTIFNENSKYNNIEIIVLQVLLINNGWFIVEVVKSSNY
jgi:hypothetical protein